jgi:glutamate-1-semialdehyde 2,1-aminomutase
LTTGGQDRQQALLERAAGCLPGGVLGRHRLPDNKSLVFARGRGAHLFDAAGREFIDFTCGGGALLLGYDHEDVVAAVKRQIEEASHFLSMANVPAIEYAADLVETIPCAELIRYTSSGAEATFMAMRLARAFTGREKIIKFEGAYHGHHDYSMWSYGPTEPVDYPRPIADTAGIPACIADTVLIAPYNDLETTARIAGEAREDLAAVIVEPIQRLIGPRPGFLEGLRALADDLGIVLIFDETVTGFRHALGGGQERFGIFPDLACYGKSLGGGLPLAAVAGRHDIMALCDPRVKDADPRAVYFSGTGFGNPVACAAGRAMLGILRQSGIYEPFFGRVERLKSSLREIIERRGIVAQVIGEGPVWHLVFSEQPIHDYRSALTADRDRLLKLHFGLIEAGIFVRPGGGHYFSMAHTDADVDATLEAVDTILAAMA